MVLIGHLDKNGNWKREGSTPPYTPLLSEKNENTDEQTDNINDKKEGLKKEKTETKNEENKDDIKDDTLGIGSVGEDISRHLLTVSFVGIVCIAVGRCTRDIKIF